MKYRLSELLTEYTEKNIEQKYIPVAVGKYGIRNRNDIYKKELSKDYSKNKIIYKNTLIIGMGSTQIDVGVLSEDKIYSVSPAYHTYRINSEIVNAEYLELLFMVKNPFFTKKYMIASARQGKKVNLNDLLYEYVEIPSFNEQINKVNKIKKYKSIIFKQERLLVFFDELIKSRFICQEVSLCY